MRRKIWRSEEKRKLVELYKISTIQELVKKFERSADSINSEIKRLKVAGKLEGYRDEETVNRSLKQR